MFGARYGLLNATSTLGQLLLATSAVTSALLLAAWLLLRRKVPTSRRPLVYVPFPEAEAAPAPGALHVDCSNKRSPQVSLTHHRQSACADSILAAAAAADADSRGDTSTALVLAAVEKKEAVLDSGCGRVTCNHFDIDGLCAVYAASAPVQAALAVAPLLRATAQLGDFRESCAPSGGGGGFAAPEARAALAICVWCNSVERARFWRPFEKQSAGSEAKESSDKFDYFLTRTAEALASAAAGPPYEALRAEAPAEFDAEFARVLADADALAEQPGGGVRRLEEIGLAVVHAPRALHYYSLFARTGGLDSVLSVMPGGRYELELKYTGYVRLATRPQWPRLALAPLAAALTAAERPVRGVDSCEWVADRLVDSGPLMRLQLPGARLTRAQRYGSPHEREIASSALPEAAFVSCVVDFFRNAKFAPRRDATWEQLHALNDAIDWRPWMQRAEEELVRAARDAQLEAT